MKPTRQPFRAPRGKRKLYSITRHVDISSSHDDVSGIFGLTVC